MSRPTIVKNGKRKSCYFPVKLVEEAETLAATRYGVSLSELLSRLMVIEKRHKKGLCHVRPRELAPN